MIILGVYVSAYGYEFCAAYLIDLLAVYPL